MDEGGMVRSTSGLGILREMLLPFGSCTTFIPYMGMKYVHTLSCIIFEGNFDLNFFAIFVHVLFVSFFWVLKHCVLMDVHCDVMLFLAGKMCTMKPSLLVRHNETSITDQSAWLEHDFQHPPTCHDIVRGMIRWTNKNMLHQYNLCWIFQRNPILDLSLSLSISPNKKDQYKANRYSRCLNPAWNFLFTNSPHQSLTVPFMKTPAVTTPRHHGVQLHLFSLWIPQLDRP